MSATTDRPRFELLVIDAGDPLVRFGHRERTVELRLRQVLKGLVRSAGFRVVSAREVPAAVPAGATDAEATATR